jgi:hypothetical protein
VKTDERRGCSGRRSTTFGIHALQEGTIREPPPAVLPFSHTLNSSCPDKLRAQKSIQLEAKPSAILSPIESKGCILHAAVRIMVGSCAAVGLWEIEILSGPCHRSWANDAVLSEARIRHEMPLGTTLWCASIKPPTVQAFRRVSLACIPHPIEVEWDPVCAPRLAGFPVNICYAFLRGQIPKPADFPVSQVLRISTSCLNLRQENCPPMVVGAITRIASAKASWRRPDKAAPW